MLSLLQHHCALKTAIAVSHDAFQALFFTVFLKMQNLLLPSKLSFVMPLQGEAEVLPSLYSYHGFLWDE